MKNQLPNLESCIQQSGRLHCLSLHSYVPTIVVAIESPSTSSTSPPMLTAGSMLVTIYTMIHHLAIMTQPVRLHSRV
jgi:hypothetical protein